MQGSQPEASSTETVETATTPDVNPSATPSTAEQGSENKSMLDAVKSVLNGPEKSPGSETQDPKAGLPEVAEAPKGEEDEARKGFTPQEWQALSKKTQDRIRSLLTEGKDVGGKIAALEPKARQFDQMVGLMQRNRLSQDDVNSTLEIAGLINTGEPQKALEKLTPIVRKLLEAAGMGNLPDDLRQKVETGAITEADARELARARAGEKLASTRLQSTQAEREAEERQRQTSDLVNLGISTADAWTQEKQANDPDWNLKSDRIQELVELHVRRSGWPQTREAMRKVFDDALTKTTTELKKFNPRPRPQKDPAVGSTSSQNAPVPKTFKEAVSLGLKR